MKRWVMAVTGLLLIGGCGPTLRSVQASPGTYAAEGGRWRAELTDSRVMLVDDDAHDGVERPLNRLPAEEWAKGCRSGGAGLGIGGSIYAMETHALGEPLEIAGKKFEKPVLVARCPGGRLLLTERDDPLCRKTDCLTLDRVAPTP